MQMNEFMTILSYSSSSESGAYWVGRIIGSLIGGVIFGFICKKVCESKGYYGSDNKGFLWGFFLGWIGLIVCACKKNLNKMNYNPYQNPNMYANPNMNNGYNPNGYNQNNYNQNGYNQNGYNGAYENTQNTQNAAGYDPNGASYGYVDLTKQSVGSNNNNNNYYNQ